VPEARQFAEARQRATARRNDAAIVSHRYCPACRAEIDGLRRVRGATKAAFDGAADLAISPAFVATLTTPSIRGRRPR
jgi:hypothetical protein